MSNQLLPCPFCGGDARMAESDTVYWVKCTECRSEGTPDVLEAKASDGWNRRATQPAAGEPVYQVMYLGPDGGGWIDVDRETMERNETAPKHFSTRTLYAAPPAAAHGDEAVPDLVPGLQWAIDYCEAMLRQGNDRMLVEVIRKRLENARDIQPAAMRAQGDGDSRHE